MQQYRSPSEQGQSFVLVAILMIALIGMLALVIDGGLTYANRRAAQNAADAGALAGAEVFCNGGTAANAIAQAQDYTVNRNNATSCNVTADSTAKSVDVTATINFDTFFAGILGHDAMTVTATASAGCFQPCAAQHVLPVAWTCHPPAGYPPDSDKCDIAYGDEDTPGPLYVIMDDEKTGFDLNCQVPPPAKGADPLPGYLDCDYDDDLVNDVWAGGDRSWLNLDGGNGNSDELKDWIEDGYSQPLPKHTWRGGSNGTKDKAFQYVETYRLDDIVLLPVYNSYCETSKGDPYTECPSLVHPEDTILYGNTNKDTYFHIINYVAFKITCVDSGGKGSCPGKDALIAANPGVYKKNMKSIEGYFIQGYNPDASGPCTGGYDTGTYTLYLKP